MIAYWWNGQKCRLFFRIVWGSYNDEKLISFLKQLLQQPRLSKLILPWGLPSHHSERTVAYLQQHKDRLHIVRLPAMLLTPILLKGYGQTYKARSLPLEV